jgi:Rieske Fe-S protein
MSSVASGDRRSFLTQTLRLLQAGIALFLAIPIVRYVLYPVLQNATSEDLWSTAGNLSEMPVGEPLKRTFLAAERDGWSERLVERSVWVVRHSDDRTAVFNAACPHLGCTIAWKAETNNFKCPCHEATFNRNGEMMNGPAARGLDKLEYKTDSGVLLVKYPT